jgi:hypothetical protein
MALKFKKVARKVLNGDEKGLSDIIRWTKVGISWESQAYIFPFSDKHPSYGKSE